MVEHELIACIAESVPAGQRQIAASMKHLVARSDEAIVRLLDFADDAAFLEPLLYTYFSPQRTQVTLDQILYGSITTESRPQSIKAHTSRDGTVFLPRVGYIATGHRNCTVLLSQSGPGEFVASAEGGRDEQAHETVPIRNISVTDIELALHRDPLTDGLMKASSDNDSHVEIEIAARQHARAIDRALGILAETAEDLLAGLLAVMRRIVVFRSESLDSFAAFSSHGTAFLQAGPDVDEVFFVEDLAHQCGHVIFNAVTLDRQEFFSVDPDTPLDSRTGIAGGTRSVYVALHGLFTECLMCICLDRCLRACLWTGRQQHEFLGRLSFILKRFQLDLQNLNQDGLLSTAGKELYRLFGRVFDEVFNRVSERIIPFDMRNQPYTFRYDRFLAVNEITAL